MKKELKCTKEKIKIHFFASEVQSKFTLFENIVRISIIWANLNIKEEKKIILIKTIYFIIQRWKKKKAGGSVWSVMIFMARDHLGVIWQENKRIERNDINIQQ